MPAITLTDLNNAKIDVDDWKEFMTSASPTYTDRLGNVRPTLVALQVEFPNASANAAAAAASAATATEEAAIAIAQAVLATTNGVAQVVLAATQADLAATNGATQVALATVQAGLATTNGAAQVDLATIQAGLATTNGAAQVTLATAAKTAAEAARDASFVTGPKYATEALGRAAVADGVNFMVQGNGTDIAAYEYRRTNSTTSVLLTTYPSVAALIIASYAESSLMPPALINKGLTLSSLWGWLSKIYDVGVNLFDASRTTAGQIPNSTGTTGGSGTFSTSHLIPVTPGVDYRRTSGGAGEYLQWFDINGAFLSAVIGTTPLTAPAGAFWARTSVSTAAAGSFMFTETSKWPAAYTAFKRTLKIANNPIPSFAELTTADPSVIPTGVTLSSVWSLISRLYVTGANLFDVSRVVPLSITTVTGGVSVHGSAGVSHLMPVTPGVDYKRSQSGVGWYLQWFTIDGAFISADTTQTATAPAGAFWARMSFGSGGANGMFTETAKYPAVFAAFQRSLRAVLNVEKTALDPNQRSSAYKPTTHGQMLDYVGTKIAPQTNLFDKSRVTPGAYLNATGGTSVSANYAVSHMIPVVAGTSYVSTQAWIAVTPVGGENVQWFDADGNFLSFLAAPQTSLTAPAGAAFARVSVINTALNSATFMPGTAMPTRYWPYEEAIARTALPRSVRPDVQVLSLPLTQADRIADNGGTVLSGTLGVDAAISIPFEFKLPTVIEFDFKLPVDIHSGVGERVLASLTADGNVGAPNLQVGINSVAPTTQAYVPLYHSTFFIGVIGYGKYYGTEAAIQNVLDRSLNGPVAFSLRKVVPTAADVTITLEVTAAQVRLFDGGTTLGAWTFAAYPTVTALISQMATALGAAYVVTAYGSDGVASTALARFTAYVCKSQTGWDVLTNLTTGVTVYDSYEVFVPVVDFQKWHKMTLEFTLVATNVVVKLYVDNILCFGDLSWAFGALTLAEVRNTLYLNKSTAGTDVYLNAPTQNLKIHHDAAPRARFIAVMNHTYIDGPEQDGVAPGGVSLTMTSGRLRRFIIAAKANGWKFITMRDFLQMQNGLMPAQDKSIVMTTDDSKFGYDDVPGCRQVCDQNEIKQTTAIISSAFNFATNQTLLNRVMSDGNAIAYHGYHHIITENITYAQFVAEMASARSTFSAAGYKSGVAIYPYGSVTPAQRLWYRNNGFTVGFLATAGLSSVVRTFGENPMNIGRGMFDDEALWAPILATLQQ
jgi:hypothetical protein